MNPDGFGCVLDCAGSLAGCGACFVGTVFDRNACGADCAAEAGAIGACYSACLRTAGPAGLVDCLVAECPTEATALNACMTPIIAAGSCDDELVTCGG